MLDTTTTILTMSPAWRECRSRAIVLRDGDGQGLRREDACKGAFGITSPNRKARRAAAAASPKMTASGKPKVVLYARYSSDKQNDQSCEHQLALERETALRLGFEIAGEFSDHAISGRTLLRSRPGISAMKDRVETGDVSAVIV